MTELSSKGSHQIWKGTLHFENERVTTHTEINDFRLWNATGKSFEYCIEQHPNSFPAKIIALYELLFFEPFCAAKDVADFFLPGLPPKPWPQKQGVNYLPNLQKKIDAIRKGFLVVNLELASSDEDELGALHMHMCYVHNGSNGMGVCHSFVSLLVRPVSDCSAQWVKHLTVDPGVEQSVALEGYMKYITNPEKPGKFIGHREFGTMPICKAKKIKGSSSAGSRISADLLTVRDGVVNGKYRSVLDVAKSWVAGDISDVGQIDKSIRPGGLLRELLIHHERKRELERVGHERVVYSVCGIAGVGKDRFAKHYLAERWISMHYPDEPWINMVYSKSGDTTWWPGYTGQPVVIFPDWQCLEKNSDKYAWPYVEFLKLMDRQDACYRVEKKGSDQLFKAELLIITHVGSLMSNLPSSDSSSRLDPTQFTRRVNLAIRMTNQKDEDPSKYTFEKVFFNEVIPRDQRNLADIVDVSNTSCPEHVVLVGEDSMDECVSSLLTYNMPSVPDAQPMFPVTPSPPGSPNGVADVLRAAQSLAPRRLDLSDEYPGEGHQFMSPPRVVRRRLL